MASWKGWAPDPSARSTGIVAWVFLVPDVGVGAGAYADAMIDVMARVDKFPRKPKVADVMTNRFYE